MRSTAVDTTSLNNIQTEACVLNIQIILKFTWATKNRFASPKVPANTLLLQFL